MNTFDLSKQWFDFAYECKEAKPHHASLWFFIIDKANRSGWKEWITMHRDISMEGSCIGSYSTYKKSLEFLEQHKFIDVDWGTKNQWKPTHVRLKCFYKSDKADGKALSKAEAKQLPKQSESTDQSTDSIYKPINNETLEPINPPTENLWEIWWNLYDVKQDEMKAQGYWSKITQEEKQKAIAHTTEFIKVTPKPYRGNPVGYIQGKKWNNEIIDRRNIKEIQEEKNSQHPKANLYDGW